MSKSETLHPRGCFRPVQFVEDDGELSGFDQAVLHRTDCKLIAAPGDEVLYELRGLIASIHSVGIAIISAAHLSCR